MEGDFMVEGWLVQPHLNQLRRDDAQVHLEPKAMEVLVYLARHAGEVLPKERIIRAVWPDTFVTDDVLKHAVVEIRKGLGDDARNPRFIQTIPRRGYRLVAPVVPARASPARYKILECLGRGAVSEVFLARDSQLKRKLALKFLLPEVEKDEIASRSLLYEAKAAAALDHPFICKIYDTGTIGGRSFIAMEYVQGQTLRERCSTSPIALVDALKIGAEIAEALELAHSRGFVHRDLKPSNIMLTQQGRVKVMDFGVALQIHKSGSAESDISDISSEIRPTPDTLPYLSPEQLSGDPVDQRSDLFSLGVILFEMLAGVHPFRQATLAETAGAILSGPPPPLSSYIPNAPPLLESDLVRLLAKRPGDRPQSIREVRMRLESIQAAERADAVRRGRQPAAPALFAGRTPASNNQSQWHQVFWASATLLLAAIAAGTWFCSCMAP